MLVSRTEHEKMKERLDYLEERMEKTDEVVFEILDLCKKIDRMLMSASVDGTLPVADSEKVYVDNDGMYDYQKYKKHAKNIRKNGGVDDGDL